MSTFLITPHSFNLSRISGSDQVYTPYPSILDLKDENTKS